MHALKAELRVARARLSHVEERAREDFASMQSKYEAIVAALKAELARLTSLNLKEGNASAGAKEEKMLRATLRIQEQEGENGRLKRELLETKAAMAVLEADAEKWKQKSAGNVNGLIETAMSSLKQVIMGCDQVVAFERGAGVAVLASVCYEEQCTNPAVGMRALRATVSCCDTRQAVQIGASWEGSQAVHPCRSRRQRGLKIATSRTNPRGAARRTSGGTT